MLWAVLARSFAPSGNTAQTRFDAIIILGASIDSDGNPSPTLLSRMTEGVREYERGVAPRILVTGGMQNGHIQADIMAHIAEAQGVPASAILIEGKAENTIQNACFSARILGEHGWGAAEVVTSPSHLPRAGMIFSRVPIHWRMHGAPSLAQHSTMSSWASSADEVLHSVYYLVYSRWAAGCSP